MIDSPIPKTAGLVDLSGLLNLLFQNAEGLAKFGEILALRSFGNQSNHDFIQSQRARSNCFETKQC